MDTADHILHPIPVHSFCCRDWPECDCVQRNESVARQLTNRLLAAMIAVCIMILVAAVIMLTGAGRAHAHSWFKDSTDPISGLGCCDNRDCVEIEDTDVMQVAGGYVFLPMDNQKGPNDKNPGFIPNNRVQQSKTSSFAVCIVGGDTPAYIPYGSVPAMPPTIRCFFAPSGF